MAGVFFEIDVWAIALIALLGIALWGLLRQKKDSQKQQPKLFFSNLHDLSLSPITWKAALAGWPRRLEYISLGLFVLAFIDPHLQLTRSNVMSSQLPEQGIAMYLVLDQSSSIAQSASSRFGKGPSKIDLLKNFARKFIEGRPDDLIGLIAFARTAKVLSPLTLDHQSLLRKLEQLQPIQDKTQDGTVIGYAIYKTVNVITATRHYGEELVGTDIPAYSIKNEVMILLTDGVQEVNPIDKGKRLRTIGLEDAAEFAKENQVKLYVINVNPEFSNAEFTPHRHLMQRITELTGGKFFMANDPTSLSEVFATIDQLEKSVLPNQDQLQAISKDQQPHRYQRVSIYPVLIGLGMVILLLAVFLRTLLLRTTP